MITDDEFEALFHEAGGDFAVPARGPDEILAAAAPPVRDGSVVPGRFRPRQLALAGTSVAAVVALTIALLTSSGGSPAPLAASPLPATGSRTRVRLRRRGRIIPRQYSRSRAAGAIRAASQAANAEARATSLTRPAR